MQVIRYILLIEPAVVISVHLHLPQVGPVVAEDPGLVNIRWRFLTFEPGPGLLIVVPELTGTHITAVTGDNQGVMTT